MGCQAAHARFGKYGDEDASTNQLREVECSGFPDFGAAECERSLGEADTFCYDEEFRLTQGQGHCRSARQTVRYFATVNEDVTCNLSAPVPYGLAKRARESKEKTLKEQFEGEGEGEDACEEADKEWEDYFGSA